MAACLNGIKGEALTLAGLKHFDSVLDTALDVSRMDRATLDALISALKDSLPMFRRYFRLKDGSFLDLSAMDEWLPLADSIFEAAQAEGAESVAMGDDTIRLQAYRACYLQSLLESLGLPIEVDEKTQETVRLLTDPGKVQDVKLPDGNGVEMVAKIKEAAFSPTTWAWAKPCR